MVVDSATLPGLSVDSLHGIVETSAGRVCLILLHLMTQFINPWNAKEMEERDGRGRGEGRRKGGGRGQGEKRGEGKKKGRRGGGGEEGKQRRKRRIGEQEKRGRWKRQRNMR